MAFINKKTIKSEFKPTLWSAFYHTSYITRLGLYKGIKKYAHLLNGKLLDFGCGSRPYKTLFHTTDQIGLDIHPTGYYDNGSEIDVYYDGKKIPFENECFDSIFSSEVLEHVPELRPILIELHRVLKPGGNILITVPFVIHEHEIPNDYHRFTSFGVQQLLKDSGFEVIDIHKTNHYIETIVQLLVWYNSSLFLNKGKLITFLKIVFMIAPFNIIGILISKLLPIKGGLYNNLVVHAKKG